MPSCRIVTMVAVLAAGCGGEILTSDGTDGTRVETAGAGSRGIDYAWGRPGAAAIRADGYSFAARYLSSDTTGKHLTHGEADALRAAGVDVVVVWEAGAGDALDGYARGAEEAKAAAQQAAACGQPAGRPIYFAIDFDAQGGDQGAIDAYFDGVASVIGRGRAGAYGGAGPIARLFDAGKIAYGWQTYAWSEGQWDGRAHLRQIDNGISVNGVDADLDVAHAADFGQWGAHGGGPVADTPERLAVAANTDGRLELFYARGQGGGSLDHDWQLAPGTAAGRGRELSDERETG